MRQRGTIVEKTGGKILVKIQDPQAACGSCRGCVRLTPPIQSGDYILSLDQTEDDYEVGEQVILQSDSKNMVKAVAVLYGVPFITLFLGYALTRLISGNDPLGGIGAVAGLLIGALGARLLTSNLLKDEPECKIVARICQ